MFLVSMRKKTQRYAHDPFNPKCNECFFRNHAMISEPKKVEVVIKVIGFHVLHLRC
jgi:hypothetical protein